MNSYERVKNCFAFEETDRPPVWDWIRNDAIIERFYGHSLTIENGRRACFETYRQVLDATKQEMRFPQVEGEFFDEDGRRHKQDRWTSWLDITDKEQFTQKVLIEGIKRKIKSLPVWNANDEKALSDLIEDYYQKQKEANSVVIFPCIPMKREFAGHVGLTEAYEYTGGIDSFSYLLYDKPVLIGDFLSALCQRTLNWIKHLPDNFHPLAVFVAEDIAFKTGLLFSPNFLREHLFPYLKKIIDAYHHRGIKVLFHSDGNCWEVMDELVDCGINGFNPIEVSAGMNVEELRRRYPNLVLCGGIDASELMVHGTPKEVFETTKKTIQATPKGYLVGGSCEIHTLQPNCKAFIFDLEDSKEIPIGGKICIQR